MSTTQRPLALVTGASSGIGYELAKQFAENGFDLVVNAENLELTQAAQELRGTGATVQEVQADLRSAAGVNAVWAAVGARGRPLAAAVPGERSHRSPSGQSAEPGSAMFRCMAPFTESGSTLAASPWALVPRPPATIFFSPFISASKPCLAT